MQILILATSVILTMVCDSACLAFSSLRCNDPVTFEKFSPGIQHATRTLDMTAKGRRTTQSIRTTRIA